MPVPSLTNIQNTAAINAARSSGPSVLTNPSIFSVTEANLLNTAQSTLNTLNPSTGNVAADTDLTTKQTTLNTLNPSADNAAADTDLTNKQTTLNTLSPTLDNAAADADLTTKQTTSVNPVQSAYAKNKSIEIAQAQGAGAGKLPDPSTENLAADAALNTAQSTLNTLNPSTDSAADAADLINKQTTVNTLSPSPAKDDFDLRVKVQQTIGSGLIVESLERKKNEAALLQARKFSNTFSQTFQVSLIEDLAGVLGKLGWLRLLADRKRRRRLPNQYERIKEGEDKVINNETNKQIQADRERENGPISINGDFRDKESYGIEKIYIANIDAGEKRGEQVTEKIELMSWPREVDYTPESKFVAIASIARNNPHYQYVGSEDTVTFKVSWYTTQDRDHVIKQCRKLEALSKANGYKSKPPRVKLVWGSQDRLFRDQLFIVVAAPYKMRDFQSAYRTPEDGFQTIGNMPQLATQDITLKRITNKNLTHKEIRYVAQKSK